MSDILLSPSNPLLQPGTLSLAPVRTKSVSQRPQMAKLRYRSAPVVSPVKCLGSPAGDPIDHRVLTWCPEDVAIGGQAGAVYLVQRMSGCRVSEALALCTSDIVLPDTLIIRALKRSRSRAVRFPEFGPQLALLISTSIHPLFRLSYRQIYRQYRNAGIIEIRPDNRYNRVTHSLRKDFIQAVQLVSNDIGITADVVGHKSKRSTIIYLKKGTHNG